MRAAGWYRQSHEALMSALLDFLPLLAFFAAYKWRDLFFATGVLIGVTLAQLAWNWWRNGTVAKLPLFTAVLAVGFGGLTLLLHDERYIKWKFSLVYWVFALAFAGSNFIGAKPLWQRALDAQVEAPRAVWVRGNTAWALFFFALGAVNVWVLSNFDTATWVNFKVWWALGALFAFTFLQVAYLSRRGRFRDQP